MLNLENIFITIFVLQTRLIWLSTSTNKITTITTTTTTIIIIIIMMGSKSRHLESLELFGRPGIVLGVG